MKSPLLHLISAALAACLLAGCEQDPTAIPCGQSVRVPTTQAYSFLRVKLEAGETCAWPLHVDDRAVPTPDGLQYVDINVLVDMRVEVEAPEPDTAPTYVLASLDGIPQREPGWVGIQSLRTGEHVLRVSSEQAVELRFVIRSEGELPERLITERSLEWPSTNSATPAVVGLGRMMALISDEGHGGLLLAHWLGSFESAEGPSRSGPAALLAELKSQQGEDPSLWNLDTLNFSVSSVQNRIDLRDATSCGQVRVVITPTVAGFAEAFQMVFLFKQPPSPLDSSPQGTLHCTATALAWARLSDAVQVVGEQSPVGLMLENVLQRPNFLRVKTSEKIGAETDYEFREWVLAVNPDPVTNPSLRHILVNRPLFQTVDTARLNTPGPDRDAFLSYVEANAAALNARTALIPTEFLAVAAVRADGVNWVPLDLTGVPPATLAAFPQLRQQIEVVGCLGCHTSKTSTQLVHSRANGARSAYLISEHFARNADLLQLSSGVPRPVPYGPLQPDPVLPP